MVPISAAGWPIESLVEWGHPKRVEASPSGFALISLWRLVWAPLCPLLPGRRSNVEAEVTFELLVVGLVALGPAQRNPILI